MFDCRFVHCVCSAFEAREDTGSLRARVRGKLLDMGAMTWTLVLHKSSTRSVPCVVFTEGFLHSYSSWASLSSRHYLQSLCCFLLFQKHCPRYQMMGFLMQVLPWQYSVKVKITQGETARDPWASWLYCLSQSGLCSFLFHPLSHDSVIEFSLEQTQGWRINQIWIYIFIHQPF